MSGDDTLTARALALRLAGVKVREIGRQLGRSPSWVTWAVEYESGGGAPRGRTVGARERWLVRRGLIP